MYLKGGPSFQMGESLFAEILLLRRGLTVAPLAELVWVIVEGLDS